MPVFHAQFAKPEEILSRLLVWPGSLSKTHVTVPLHRKISLQFSTQHTPVPSAVLWVQQAFVSYHQCLLAYTQIYAILTTS